MKGCKIMGKDTNSQKIGRLNNTSRLLIILAIVASSFFVIKSVLAAVTFQDINPDNSTVTQSSNATSGGRVNGLAADPNNNQVAYAASEWGGIYKTPDGGTTWTHLDGHIPQATWDVAVDPSNSSRVYATSFYDGRATNNALAYQPLSGIEVSNDGGTTWTHPITATPSTGFNCNATRRTEPSAFGIGIRPDAPNNVFIGTNCGIAISRDSGGTWVFVDPTPLTAASNVWDVVVQAGGANGIVDICGQDGHFRSIDGGTTWTSSVTNVLGARADGRCSIDASPLESGVLYAMSANALWEGDADTSGVVQWTQLQGNLGARIEFVVTNQTGTNTFDVYMGAGTTLRRIIGCDNSTTPTRCPSGTSGNDVGNANGAHADPGNLEFDLTQPIPRCPLFYSNDGGIYKNGSNTSPGCLNPNWQRSMVGLHATWLWDMAVTPLTGNTGVYFGLQDDGF